MSIHKKASLVGTIESLLQAVETEKAASHTEAGGYDGGSSHPSASVDDSTQAASEGSRSSENSEDVKDANPELSVDAASDGPTDGGQDSVTVDVGMKAKATGEDPSNETSGVGAGKDDPGSDHPARTDNDSLDGEKYSSAMEELRVLAKQAEEIGSDICSMIATTSGQPAAYPTANKEAEESAQAGYDLAGVFDGFDVSHEDKNAADAMVVDTIGEVIELANARAEKTAEFFSSHFNTVQKQAIDGMYDEADTDEEDAAIEMPEEGMGEEGGEIPPELLEAIMQAQGGGEGLEEGMGEEGGVGPEEEALLEALLQGEGGGMGGGEVPGAEDALAAMGGEEELPEEGGEGEDLAILEQVLADSGLEPEAIQEALKSASAPRINLNTTGRREKYAKMRDVILELVNRSR